MAMAIPQTFSFSVGAVAWMACSTAPSGMLLCDGAAISRSAYAALFAVIGTKFGAGNGSTTFNVPDFGGKVAIGFKAAESDYDDMGKTGGEKTHSLSVAELAAHGHSASQPAHGHSASQPAHTHTVDRGTATSGGGAIAYISTYVVSGSQNSGSAGNDAVTVAAGGGDAVTVNDAGSGTAHENRPLFVTIYAYIKT
jgi:microcystin-dependent protein